ncbi:hypothetical protein LDENG_00128470 [Lucifuga dentata]|nr:hypothetical protein LDENG_00128470 [Lucifuga dentata]
MIFKIEAFHHQLIMFDFSFYPCFSIFFFFFFFCSEMNAFFRSFLSASCCSSELPKCFCRMPVCLYQRT